MNVFAMRLDRPGVRLGWALGASLVLHLALLVPARWWPLAAVSVPLPPLTVELAEPEPVQALATQAEPELPPEPTVAPAPTFPAAAPAVAPKPLRGKALAAATTALSKELFYPREAIERGLEGRVVLLLHLDAAGRILSAEVASSSGHAILDAAALQAARRIAVVSGQTRQVLLPVDFRLD